jgi:hypothetical protein
MDRIGGGEGTCGTGGPLPVSVGHCARPCTPPLGPERVVSMLNDHFDVLAGLLAGHSGYVLDFLGGLR